MNYSTTLEDWDEGAYRKEVWADTLGNVRGGFRRLRSIAPTQTGDEQAITYRKIEILKQRMIESGKFDPDNDWEHISVARSRKKDLAQDILNNALEDE